MYRKELAEAHFRISPYIHRTEVLQSKLINSKAQCEIFFKCENFQKMGAFKMRGACNAILQLSEKERANGVITHSSGNMAQAVSLAAQLLGVKAYIVMPSNAPSVKKAAVRDYGGEITECIPTIEEREKTCDAIISKTGASFIHPSNDLNVILGQATAAKELLIDYTDIDVVLAPVGGGGLLAGTALSCLHRKIECIGAEPMNADDAYRSLLSGKIETNESADTIADGLRTHLGDINFPIIQKYVSEIIRVEEEEIIQAMRLIWERMKIIIEPSCAVPCAAVLKQPSTFKGKKVGIIITGGNVDLSKLPF